MLANRLPSEADAVALADAYRTTNPLSESRLGQLAAGNPMFYSRLRAGSSCTIRLYARVLGWFSGHWPDGLEWPPDVPRPEPAPSPASSDEAKEAA